ncbi:MAG TPA: ATP-binding protein, partial [Blastocatellia bacterium]|nr:ATP-binding protein [Blastocatellia bacterium]
SPALGEVKADPGQIEQILMNLAVNARDAMPRGGSLTIETQNVYLDETYCRALTDLLPGDYILLAVSDTGAGMDEATRGRIFEPFFTTKGVGRGTGLGLATVHGIVKQSNGHVAVYSEVGHGTAFKIYLPLISGPLTAMRSSVSSTEMPKGVETVLLVEDEDAVRALATHVLGQCGYQVLDAANGMDAIRLAETMTEPIHLLISDVVMPHLGGRALAERFAVLRPDCKVLFLSGYTDDAVIRHGVLEAEFAFLQKPFSPSSLAQKVRSVLDMPDLKKEGES